MQQWQCSEEEPKVDGGYVLVMLGWFSKEDDGGIWCQGMKGYYWEGCRLLFCNFFFFIIGRKYFEIGICCLLGKESLIVDGLG